MLLYKCLKKQKQKFIFLKYIMLYALKQIKGGVNGFIQMGFDNSEAKTIVDDINKDNSKKLSRSEVIDFIKQENTKYEKQIKDIVLDIWNENDNKNWISIEKFKNLLTKQTLERKEIKKQGDTTEKTKKEIAELDKSMDNEIKFTRTLKLTKPYMKGDDVRALQLAIWIKELDADWVFSLDTKKALVEFQKQKLGQKGDGIMNFNWSTMRFLNWLINSSTQNHIDNLNMVADYAKAYSNVYWDMDKIINRHHGLLWQILKYTSDSDVSKLQNKLGVKYPNVTTEEKLIKEFKLDKNSSEYKKGLMRIITALAVSALTTTISLGWNTIDLLVELFWINKNQIWNLLGIKDWGVSYTKSLPPEEIVKILIGKKIDYKKDAQLAYISWMKTNKEIQEVLKASLRVDIPNLKRVTETIKNNNLLEDFAELFNDEIGDLIDSLESETNPKKVDNIMWKIWLKILPKLYEAQKSWNIKAKNAYIELASIIWRYNNIEKKYDKVNGIRLDTNRIKELADKADKWIAKVYKRKWVNLKLTTNTEKLHTDSWSFRYNLSEVKNFKEYTQKLAEHTYKKWGESMLATIMATIAEQTSWLSFGPNHFIEWMENMKKVSNPEMVKILSNLWRHKWQQFQWTLKTALWKWVLYEMKIDWFTIYFKDKCTNPVAVVNDLSTTVQFAGSIPFYANINIMRKKLFQEPEDPKIEDTVTQPEGQVTPPPLIKEEVLAEEINNF